MRQVKKTPPSIGKLFYIAVKRAFLWNQLAHFDETEY